MKHDDYQYLTALSNNILQSTSNVHHQYDVKMNYGDFSKKEVKTLKIKYLHPSS